MPDLSAQQPHDLIQPLWEREPELRPNGLEVLDSTHPPGFRWMLFAEHVYESVAVQLCESSMVRWLAKQRTDQSGAVHIDLDDGVVQVWVYISDETSPISTGPTLVQALASACSAVLDAKDGGSAA